MKNTILAIPRSWRISLAVTLGLLVLVAMVGAALAQEPVGDEPQLPDGGSAIDTFSYQGYLEDGGAAANGAYDFLFSVHDASVGGSQIGSTITYGDLLVTDGVFVAYLSPVSPLTDLFTGGPRWLQIEVRPGASVGAYTDMGRQPISPTPYAWGVRSGVIISGTTYTATGFGDAIVNVDNTRDTAGGGASSAIFARATTGYAVRGESGGVGVYGYSLWTYAMQGWSYLGTAARFDSGEGYGVWASTSGDDHWDHGGYFTAESGYGVYGESTDNYGVRGDGYWGVRGDGQAGGVIGWSSAGDGVRGSSSTGIGVEGSSVSSYGVHGYSQYDIGVIGLQQGYSEADLGVSYYKPGGLFAGANGVVGITKATNGFAVFGQDKSASGGWAGFFTSLNGSGVYISAPQGNAGLNVASGTKNAVVATDEGSRLLYTEESTEIWFTDYGFGQLETDLAVITIDPVFAQTVNLDEPYHVFVQAYGDAELYVSDRTSTQFEVHLGDGEPGTEFSYRIVAKRLGYEDDRLERAPWADNDPNLYPDQIQDGTSAQQPVQGGSQ